MWFTPDSLHPISEPSSQCPVSNHGNPDYPHPHYLFPPPSRLEGSYDTLPFPTPKCLPALFTTTAHHILLPISLLLRTGGEMVSQVEKIA